MPRQKAGIDTCSNPKALFLSCANNSLSLCGAHDFSCIPTSVTFFGILENTHNFFSCSSHQWEILVAVVGVTVKRLSDTRWSAQHGAMKPVKNHFDQLVDAVEKLCDQSENLNTRG